MRKFLSVLILMNYNVKSSKRRGYWKNWRSQLRESELQDKLKFTHQKSLITCLLLFRAIRLHFIQNQYYKFTSLRKQLTETFCPSTRCWDYDPLKKRCFVKPRTSVVRVVKI